MRNLKTDMLWRMVGVTRVELARFAAVQQRVTAADVVVLGDDCRGRRLE